jgi:hypothetical protein
MAPGIPVVARSLRARASRSVPLSEESKDQLLTSLTSYPSLNIRQHILLLVVPLLPFIAGIEMTLVGSFYR